jgi:hypothetical protein
MRSLTALIVDWFYSSGEAREIEPDFLLRAIQFFASLVRYREFSNDFGEHVHAFVEGSKEYSLVVSVHPF